MTTRTTRDAAEECGCSMRTMQRHLACLDSEPVLYERDRRIRLVTDDEMAMLRQRGHCSGPKARPEPDPEPAPLTVQERRLLRYFSTLTVSDRAFVMSLMARIIPQERREYRRKDNA